MKSILLLTLTIFSTLVYGQDKYNYVQFNKLTEVGGTEYMIASIEHWGKLLDTKSKYLLFINTKTGESVQVDFPADSWTEKLEQIRIDSLGINSILVAARTIDMDGKSGIDWSDPTQIFILSPNGKEKKQLTDSKFFVKTWMVNRLTGILVVTGYSDTNNNNKYDKTDKNEIHLYDLKSLTLKGKI